MRMATLQVKRLPDDVYDALRQRAKGQGISLSELVTRILRRDVAYPSLTEWLDAVPSPAGPARDVDIESLIDEIRDTED